MAKNDIAIPVPPEGYELQGVEVATEEQPVEITPQEIVDAEDLSFEEGDIAETLEDEAEPKEITRVVLSSNESDVDYEEDLTGYHEHNPSNWHIRPTEEDGVVTATNTITGRTFKGTTKELSALFK